MQEHERYMAMALEAARADAAPASLQ